MLFYWPSLSDFSFSVDHAPISRAGDREREPLLLPTAEVDGVSARNEKRTNFSLRGVQVVRDGGVCQGAETDNMTQSR